MGTSLLSNATAVSPRGTASGTSESTGLHRLLQRLKGPWKVWREQRRAAACCREILRLDRLIAAGQPWLPQSERYRKVVAAYTVADLAHAKAVLDCTQASFASWPVERDLSLRDVAHYLAVSELLAASGEAGGVQASLKRVIDSTIPAGL